MAPAKRIPKSSAIVERAVRQSDRELCSQCKSKSKIRRNPGKEQNSSLEVQPRQLWYGPVEWFIENIEQNGLAMTLLEIVCRVFGFALGVRLFHYIRNSFSL